MPRDALIQARRGPAGLLLLLLAITLLAVTAAVNRPGIEGRAVALPPDPPPAVGGCLVEPAPESFVIGADGTVVPRLPVGGCDRPHFGEVVLYLDLTGAVTSPGSNECSFATDPFRFLGVDTEATDTWVPLLDLTVVPISPDPRQYAAGQRWVACAVAARQGTAGFLPALRDTFPERSAPAAFGLCSNAAEPLRATNVQCVLPHVTELFATYRFEGGGPPSALRESCDALVARQTGGADLESAPGLDITVDLFATDGGALQRAASAEQGSYVAVCQVSSTGGRTLGASLRSLGAGPIPWTS